MAKPAAKSNVQKLRDTASNQISKEKIEEIMLKLEDYDDRLDTQKGKHMQKCKVIRDERSEYFEKIAGQGISTKAMKEVYGAKKDLARAKARVTKLNEETAPVWEHAVDQLSLFG